MSRENDSPYVGFSTVEAPELTTYRPVNRLALVAAASALLAPLALAHPLLAALPVLSAVLAAAALRSITPDQIGRKLALATIIVALVFASWGPTRALYRQALLARLAEAYAEQWFAVVAEGRLRDAHQLTLSFPSRVAPDRSLDEVYSEPDEEDHAHQMMLEDPNNLYHDYQKFAATEPLKTISNWPEGFEVKLLANEGVARPYHDVELVNLLYEIKRRGEGESRQMTVRLERNQQGEFAYWRVADFKDPRRVTGAPTPTPLEMSGSLSE